MILLEVPRIDKDDKLHYFTKGLQT
ncbi:unnamed protein product [Spirodela intermedia]|uniref:Uncharacterized protein n=1 Tax=Spirodela intermedia TaxID=51605 RepID=A0A7I8LHY1_SPIIN|nr:unnamed protein product [Spirodela intermedia]